MPKPSAEEIARRARFHFDGAEAISIRAAKDAVAETDAYWKEHYADLLASREAEVEALRAELHGCQDGALVRDLKARVEWLTAELADEEPRADLHANINRAVSDALGQPIGASWHDLGDKVAALKAENVALREKVTKLEDELAEYSVHAAGCAVHRRTLDEIERNGWPACTCGLADALKG